MVVAIDCCRRVVGGLEDVHAEPGSRAFSTAQPTSAIQHAWHTTEYVALRGSLLGSSVPVRRAA